MPYKNSTARKTFNSELHSISLRVRASQGRVVNPDIREYVLAASIFLAHAALENYISDIFSGFAVGVRSKALKGSQLHENLRAHLFLSKLNTNKVYGAALGLNSEQDAYSAVSASLKGYAGTVVDDDKLIFPFLGKDIYATNKYPSKDNLNKIFERIGISKIFSHLSAKMKRDSVSALESLGDLRSQLAHTGQIPGVSPKDVIFRMNGIKSFVGATDRIMYKKLVSMYGQSTWDDCVAN